MWKLTVTSVNKTLPPYLPHPKTRSLLCNFDLWLHDIQSFKKFLWLYNECVRANHRLIFNPPIMWSECWQACKKTGPRGHNSGLRPELWADGAVPSALAVHLFEELALRAQDCAHSVNTWLNTYHSVLIPWTAPSYRCGDWPKCRLNKWLTLDFSYSFWYMIYILADGLIIVLSDHLPYCLRVNNCLMYSTQQSVAAIFRLEA